MKEFFATPTEVEQFQFEVNIPENEIAEVSEILKSRAATGELEPEAKLLAPFRATSHIAIGDALVFPLTEQEMDVSPDIKRQLNDYEFSRAHLVCSFDPAKRCSFSDARFGVSLTAQPADAVEDAIAYDLYPREVQDSYEVSRKYSLTPTLEFSFGPFTVSTELPHEQTEEYIVYNNQITAFGKGTRIPAWHFERTQSHEIKGVQELFMLIRKPKSSQIEATLRLKVTLEVMTKLGPFSFPLTPLYRDKSVGSAITDKLTIPLC
jgi:hypothetical protein